MRAFKVFLDSFNNIIRDLDLFEIFIELLCYLFFPKPFCSMLAVIFRAYKGNSFEKEVKIRPQTHKIINAVYGVRRKDPSGLTLAEFCYPRKIADNDRTISTRINELNKL